MAGRDRTCGAPRFRRALYRAELRPRARRAASPSSSAGDGARRSGDDARCPHDTSGVLTPARCCPSHSPTLRPWIGRRRLRDRPVVRPTWRGIGAGASGAMAKMRRQKHGVLAQRHFGAAEGLSLSGGASIRSYDFFKLSITSGALGLRAASETTKATLLGRPRTEPLCRLGTSGHASGRERCRCRADRRQTGGRRAALP